VAYEPNRAEVLASLQRALIGEVFPSLRAVTAEWSTNLVRFFVHVDGGPPSVEELDSVSSVSAEVAADFPHEVRVEHVVVQWDSALPAPDARLCVFLRGDAAEWGAAR
jgi:hypothetical protein